MSVTVNIIRNPFEPQLRERRELPFEPACAVRDYLPAIELHGDLELSVAQNGHQLDPPYDQEVRDGDIISATVTVQGQAGIAVAGYVAGALFTAGTVAYAATWAIVYLATVFAIGYGVSQLVSALGLGPEVPDMGGEGEGQSPTYGWGPLQQLETQGNPIPVLFGDQLVAGQVINQYTTVEDDDKEYIHILLAVADHEVDSISDIRINDQPATAYKGVTTYTRPGQLHDSVIPGFAQIVTQVNLQVRFHEDGDSHTQRTDGNSVQTLQLVMSAPRGLYAAGEEGELDENSVELEIQYRAVGASSWIPHGTTQITGSTTEPVRKQVDITDLSPDQYEVMITRKTKSEESFQEQKTVEWTQQNEIIDEELIYPGIAKYAIKALATDQLSGQKPRVSCLAERETVPVYNPYSEAWEYKEAKNPAWQTYWLLNTHHQIHHSRILFDEFQDWAAYADEIIEGEDEPRFRCSLYLDREASAWSQVQRAARLGRGVVLRRGTKYGVFVDKPEDTVSHLFTPGNIISETFAMQYLPQKERANAAEITYNDPDRDYTTQVVAVFSDDYASSTSKAQKSSLQFEAAITRSQAIREAAFLLNSNRYLVRTIEFEAAADSFAAVVGDLVYFQHFVPHYEDSSGGRVVDAGNDDGSGSPYLQVDEEITLESGTSYAVLVRLSDDSLVEKQLQTVSSTHTTDTLLLDSDWADVPQRFDVYVCGVATTYKRTYRIINITRAKDLTRRITCLEYQDGVYNDTGYVIENPTWGEEVVQQAANVQATEFLTYGRGGDYQSNVAVSWYPATSNVSSNWAVWIANKTLSRDFEDDTFDEDDFAETDPGTGAGLVGETSRNNITIGASYLTQGHTYEIYVVPAGQGGPTSDSPGTTIQVLGKLAPPDDVVSLSGKWKPTKRTVVLSWQQVDNIDLSHYEIRQGTNWDDAEVVVKEAKKGSTALSIDEGVSETRTYLIKAVDTSDVYSVNYASTDVAIDTNDTPIDTPTGLNLTTSSDIATDGANRVGILATWDNNAEADPEFHHYNLLIEEMASGHKSEVSTKETQYQFEVEPSKEYGVSVQAVDISGNETPYASQVTILAAKDDTPPSKPVNLTATGFVGFIRIKWDHGGEIDLSHFDLYRNTSNDFSGASRVGASVKDFAGTWAIFQDDPGDYSTYYYWVVALDRSGNESSEAGPVSGSKVQVGGINIEDLSITETKVKDGSISTPKLQAEAVTANEISAGSVTTEKVDANAITASKITSAAVTTDKLDAGAVTANKIDVAQLSAISADIGEITAGLIKSTNWSSSDGMKIDLDNEVLEVGGYNSPDLSWDGVNLSVVGNITVDSGTGALNFDDGPSESGADVTGNNTADDTSNVNGLPSTNVSGWSSTSDSTKIDGGQIYTGSVTATQITASEAVITDTAQLGDATVDTLKIKKNAVLVPTATDIGSITITGNLGTWLKIGEVSLDSDGQPVSVEGQFIFEFQQSYGTYPSNTNITYYDFKIEKNGYDEKVWERAARVTYDYDVDSDYTYVVSELQGFGSHVHKYLDTSPGTGTNTYSFWVKPHGDYDWDVTLTDGQITAIGMKR